MNIKEAKQQIQNTITAYLTERKVVCGKQLPVECSP